MDANSAYGLADADIFAMDDADLLLIEQPLSNDDIFQHIKLQRGLKTAICLDESIHSVDDAEAALDLAACRIINIKPGRVGGFTQALKIHDLAAGTRRRRVGGCWRVGSDAGNVAIASLPNFRLPGDLSASQRYCHRILSSPNLR